MKKNPIEIIFVATEFAPYAQYGGLADVIAGLPRVLAQMGHSVSIFLPHYMQFHTVDEKITTLYDNLNVPILNYTRPLKISRLNTESSVAIYLLHNHDLFSRQGLYGEDYRDYPDNAERFIFFNKAVLIAIKTLGINCDILHVHNWQCGLIPVYLKSNFLNDPFWGNIKTLYTFHNAAYQGLFWHFDMPMTGLPWKLFNPEQLEYFGKINFHKAGIIFADAFNTVSSTYAKEIRNEPYGAGLEGLFSKFQDRFRGILNGVDTQIWNPINDRFLPSVFSADALTAKGNCKTAIMEKAGLPPSTNLPLLIFPGKFIERKGIEILRPLIPDLMARNIPLIIAGRGHPSYEQYFTEIAAEYPGRLAVILHEETEILHQLIAGGDILLMPSKIEPSGLIQMVGQLYGTLPVAHKTGGLVDSIAPFQTEDDAESATGFLFEEYSSDAFKQSLDQAIDIWKNHQDLWQKMIRAAMSQDYSWEKQALQYIDIYHTIL